MRHIVHATILAASVFAALGAGATAASAQDPEPTVAGNGFQPSAADADPCGNTFNFVGILNPAEGNICGNR
ncbi:chaplin family protein [Actinomadura gamaensis]|uniref:Chaplin family protein n=1 Tax=Actinomadura gamaensis TaxID=1763541 RepID=A0ABV9UCH7_9ACTN